MKFRNFIVKEINNIDKFRTKICFWFKSIKWLNLINVFMRKRFELSVEDH